MATTYMKESLRLDSPRFKPDVSRQVRESLDRTKVVSAERRSELEAFAQDAQRMFAHGSKVRPS